MTWQPPSRLTLHFVVCRVWSASTGFSSLRAPCYKKIFNPGDDLTNIENKTPGSRCTSMREMTKIKTEETSNILEPVVVSLSAVKPEPISGCSDENLMSRPELQPHHMDFLTTPHCIKPEPLMRDSPDTVAGYQSWKESLTLPVDMPIQTEQLVSSIDQKTPTIRQKFPQTGDEIRNETSMSDDSKNLCMCIPGKLEETLVECAEVVEKNPYSYNRCVKSPPVPVALYRHIAKPVVTAEYENGFVENSGGIREKQNILSDSPSMSSGVTSEESKLNLHEDKRHKYLVCGYKSVTKYHHLEHSRNHKEEKRAACGNCFVTKSSPSKHAMTHTRKPFPCTICDHRAATNSNLIVHMRKHTGEKPFVCTVCDHRFASSSELVGHMRKHTGEKPFKCTVCDYSFVRSNDLGRHMRTHTGEKPFKCTVCEYRSTNKGNLVVHMRSHSGEEPYQCSICYKKKSSKRALNAHMLKHTGERPFMCTVCGRWFSSSSARAEHMMVHTGERRFLCTVCGHRSRTNRDRLVHMRRHTGEKPYKCTVCDYRSANSHDVVVHVRTHTGEKPYMCKHCDYRCSASGRLTEHMRTHTGEKPFKCTICSSLYAQKSSLNRHIKTHRNTGERT